MRTNPQKFKGLSGYDEVALQRDALDLQKSSERFIQRQTDRPSREHEAMDHARETSSAFEILLAKLGGDWVHWGTETWDPFFGNEFAILRPG